MNIDHSNKRGDHCQKFLLLGFPDSAILFRTIFGKTMRKNPQARILRKQNWGDYFLLALESPGIAAEAQPGQFLMVRVGDTSSPLLRRPLSIHAVQDNTLEIFFQTSGSGTTLLSRKQEGDRIDILGPLGRGFNLDFDGSTPKAALVGGGRGIAPLYFLSQRFRQQGISATIYYGGKSVEDLPLREKFRATGYALHCSTEDGSHGFKGLITDSLLQDLSQDRADRIYACGPEGMLKRLSEISQEYAIPAELSLEAIMGCGFGACWGCVHRLKKDQEIGWQKICEDGPVFPAEMIIWEKE